MALPPPAPSEPAPESELARIIVEDDAATFQLELQPAARAMEIERIWLFTQKGLFTHRILAAMGLEGLDRDIIGLAQVGGPGPSRMADSLRRGRSRLFDETREFVEEQFTLYARNSGVRLHDEFLERMRLSAVSRRDRERMAMIIRRMAKRLATLHSRRLRTARRGHLDVRATLRHNHATGGVPFELHWRRKLVNKPRIVALCDVSGSVEWIAQFLLMFPYCLNEIVSDVHAFAFCSHLEEVTDLFEAGRLEDAAAGVMRRVGLGSTDYGQSFVDFERLGLERVDRRTTVIVLGDAAQQLRPAESRYPQEDPRARPAGHLAQSGGSIDLEQRRFGDDALSRLCRRRQDHPYR